MIRVDLGPDGLARTRFVISPLLATNQLLYLLGRNQYRLSSQWRGLAKAALRDHHLDLLEMVARTGDGGYHPDPTNPVPTRFGGSPGGEPHQVATTSMERVRYEFSIAIGGHVLGNESA